VERGFVELFICAIKPIPDAIPAIARVELDVVKVMELGGEVEWEVVAAVVVHHLQDYKTKP